MSNRRNRKVPRACKGKRRYRDRQEANRALHLLANTSARETVPERAYDCPRCHGVHVTSKPAR